MKRIAFLLLIAALPFFSFRARTDNSWTLDPMHSQLNFSLSLMMLSDIEGSFMITQGKITTPGEDFSNASVELVADTKSIDTDNDQRDTHLRTADFFDAEKYPTINFKSDSFKKTGTDTYTVAGKLTFHGVTKPVTLTVVGKTGIHPVTKKTVAGFRVKGMIKRSDFGIAVTTPSAMLSDEVNIHANVQFTKE